MSVIKFPREYRQPLPDDAVPLGKERHAVIFPIDAMWAFMETDEGGGHLVTGLTKEQAVVSGFELVMEYRGTLEIRNTPPEEPEGAA